MAVAFVSSAGAHGSGTYVDVTVTVSGTNPYLVIFASYWSWTLSVSSVTYNSAALGSGWITENSQGYTAAAGGIPQSSGTYTLRVNFSGSTDYCSAVVFCFEGVDPTTPYVTPIIDSGGNTQYPGFTMSGIPTDGMAFVALNVHAGDLPTDSGNSFGNDYASTGGGDDTLAGTKTADGAVNYTALSLVRLVQQVGVALNPVAAAATLAPKPLIIGDAVNRAANW